TNWGSAFLPAAYQGTPLGNAAVPADQARVRYIQNTRLPVEVQRLQLDQLARMNRQHQDRTTGRAGSRKGPEDALEARINSFELGFGRQRKMPEAENIGSESPATRRLYGLDDPVTANFGRQCLLARRFVERGVRFVQVTHSDAAVQWDQHANLRR